MLSLRNIPSVCFVSKFYNILVIKNHRKNRVIAVSQCMQVFKFLLTTIYIEINKSIFICIFIDENFVTCIVERYAVNQRIRTMVLNNNATIILPRFTVYRVFLRYLSTSKFVNL